MKNLIYKTQITSCGSEAQEALKSNFLVLFEDGVNEILRSIAFIHSKQFIADSKQSFGIVEIENISYKVLSCGDVVWENLTNLGHCTFSFCKNLDDNLLPGTVYLKSDSIPAISVGMTLSIYGREETK